MLDLTTGVSYGYRADKLYTTMSTIKVAILMTLLDNCQDQGRELTSTERVLADRMIRRSDNAATNQLFTRAGGADAVQAYLNQLGLGHTTVSKSWWGGSQTTPNDQILLLRHLVTDGSGLSASNRDYVLELMGTVISTQRWGVGKGSPGMTTAQKNGWGPQGSRYIANSIGWVRDDDSSYLIAIFGTGTSFSNGQALATSAAKIALQYLD